MHKYRHTFIAMDFRCITVVAGNHVLHRAFYVSLGNIRLQTADCTNNFLGRMENTLTPHSQPFQEYLKNNIHCIVMQWCIFQRDGTAGCRAGFAGGRTEPGAAASRGNGVTFSAGNVVLCFTL